MTNPIARMTGIWIACTRRAFAALRCARSAASSVKPASMSAAVAVPLTSTLRRSPEDGVPFPGGRQWARSAQAGAPQLGAQRLDVVEQLHDERRPALTWPIRSEEHTSELQSRSDRVCRL